jgi:predicted Zn finger-like uncharacterized protein
MTSFTVHCTHCDTAFPVDPEKVPDGGVRARCTNCEGIFFVGKPAATEAPVAPPKPDVVPATEPETGSAAEPDADAEPDVDFETRAAAEVALDPEPTPGVALESVTTDHDDAGFGSFDDEIEVVESAPVAEAVEDAPATEPAVEDAPETEPAVADAPATESAADVIEEFEVTSSAEVEDVVEPDTDWIGDGAEEVSPVSVDETPTPVAPGPAHLEEDIPPVPTGFQFGKRDPLEKARRLARVLVSDMITYNPDRHSQALARGTLAEDFEDEIAKSWEEYVDQVGPELAGSTPYWIEALNQVLAKGNEVF